MNTPDNQKSPQNEDFRRSVREPAEADTGSIADQAATNEDAALEKGLYAILDRYYELKRPQDLGIESENKLMQLITNYIARKTVEARLDEQLHTFGFDDGSLYFTKAEKHTDNAVSQGERIEVLKLQLHKLDGGQEL